MRTRTVVHGRRFSAANPSDRLNRRAYDSESVALPVDLRRLNRNGLYVPPQYHRQDESALSPVLLGSFVTYVASCFSTNNGNYAKLDRRSA